MNRQYEKIVDRLIEAMERGIIPWKQPWLTPVNAVSGKPYRGINQLILSTREFSDPRYLTYRQAQVLGGTVRRGEVGFPVIKWHFPTDEEVQNNPNARPWGRGYTVFNVNQCEKLTRLPVLAKIEHDSIAEAQTIVDEWTEGPGIEFGGFRAAYNVAKDTIFMPEMSKFTSPEGYYDTLFHEMVHSTGHVTRLDRQSPDYATEELIAEVGCSFLSAQVGISIPEVADNHVAYLQSWLTALKNDKSMLVKAASSAAKAADFIMGRSHQNEEAETSADLAA